MFRKICQRDIKLPAIKMNYKATIVQTNVLPQEEISGLGWKAETYLSYDKASPQGSKSVIPVCCNNFPHWVAQTTGTSSLVRKAESSDQGACRAGPWENLLSLQMAIFSMPLPLQRAEEASPLPSSYNDHNPTRGAPTGSHFKHHHVGIRVLTNEFGGRESTPRVSPHWRTDSQNSTCIRAAAFKCLTHRTPFTLHPRVYKPLYSNDP